MSSIPSATLTLVRFRDFNLCVRCRAPATETQHRMRRREGGHAASNLIRACSACHAWMHANPRGARELGFIVPTWASPQETPVKTWRGWLLLDDNGRVAPCDSPNIPHGKEGAR